MTDYPDFCKKAENLGAIDPLCVMFCNGLAFLEKINKALFGTVLFLSVLNRMMRTEFSPCHSV